MIKYITTFIFILIPGFLYAGAFDNTLPLAAPAARGETYVSGPAEIESMEYNPAVLAGIPDVRLIFSYRDYYGLKLLTQKYAGVSAPASSNVNVGFTVNQTGTTSNVDFIDYSEAVYTIGVGGNIESVAGLAGGANFRFFRVVSDENASGWGIDLGATWKPQWDKNLLVGAAARNVNSPRISWTTGADDNLDRVFALGASYSLYDAVVSAGYDEGFNLGVHYAVVEGVLSVRAGLKDFSESSRVLSFGIGAGRGNYNFDYAFTAHNLLGNTHYFTLKAKLGRIKNEN